MTKRIVTALIALAGACSKGASAPDASLPDASFADAGLATNFHWRTVLEVPRGAPNRFRESGGDLWAYGPSVARRRDGVWQLFDVCGDGGASGAEVAVGPGSTVWALCTKAAPRGGQSLLRWDGARASPLVMPEDGVRALVQTATGALLMGRRALYRPEVDGSFTPLGPSWGGAITEAAAIESAGASESDLYADNGAVAHWDGRAWTPVAPPVFACTPYLRGGQAFCGSWALSGNTAMMLAVPDAGALTHSLFGELPGGEALLVQLQPVDGGTTPYGAPLFTPATFALLQPDGGMNAIGDGPPGIPPRPGRDSTRFGYAIDERTIVLSWGAKLIEGVR